MLLNKETAESFECPYKDKKCSTENCMAWSWESDFCEAIYKNNLSINFEKDSKMLKEKGYVELPAHGFGLDLKTYFPMTIEEKQDAAKAGYGNQVIFGLRTTDKSLWLGKCSCLSSGGHN